MKKFTTKGQKILRNIRRRDFDVLRDNFDNKEIREDIHSLRKISNENKELLNFLTYFKSFDEKKDLKTIIDKLKNISDEDISIFQKFYDMDYKYHDDDFYVSTSYIAEKYSDEELDFLLSLTDEDLDDFEDDYDDFVDEELLYEDEIDSYFEEYLSSKEIKELFEDEDFYEFYLESDYYDEDDLDDDGKTEYFYEVFDDDYAESDYERESVNTNKTYFQSYATKDDYFMKINNQKKETNIYDYSSYENENNSNLKDKLKITLFILSLIIIFVLAVLFIGF